MWKKSCETHTVIYCYLSLTFTNIQQVLDRPSSISTVQHNLLFAISLNSHTVHQCLCHSPTLTRWWHHNLGHKTSEESAHNTTQSIVRRITGECKQRRLLHIGPLWPEGTWTSHPSEQTLELGINSDGPSHQKPIKNQNLRSMSLGLFSVSRVSWK